MIDRDPEADDLLSLAEGGHSFRLVGPRRYGKTTLLRRVLEAAEREGAATVLVDLQDVLSIAEIVVRIERATSGSRGRSGGTRRGAPPRVEHRLSVGGGGFAATLQRNWNVDAESVLLRLLELPVALFDREGTTSLIIFDEIQDVLAVAGADGKIRSVIQHHGGGDLCLRRLGAGGHAAAVRGSEAAPARPGGATAPGAAAGHRRRRVRHPAL